MLGDLAHVAAELRASLGPLRPVVPVDPFDRRRRVILSDIDDTLYQSVTGGRKWYVRACVRACVRSFVRSVRKQPNPPPTNCVAQRRIHAACTHTHARLHDCPHF